MPILIILKVKPLQCFKKDVKVNFSDVIRIADCIANTESIALVTLPSLFNCWTSVAPAFRSWFAVKYSSCFSFIS